jgi:uncharacterized peroxidase-related enzyme
MAWIDTVSEDTATRPLKDIYDQIDAHRGKVANILKAQSLNPDALRAHLDLYETLLFGISDLSRVEREMIAVVVSAENGCAYCVRHHQAALAARVDDEALIEQLAADYTAVGVPEPLTEKQRVMLDYAARLTTDVADMAETDVDALREAGWKSRGILDINLVASYFNFVNRIAEGLGVEATAEEVEGYNY